jgi:HIRAN domain
VSREKESFQYVKPCTFLPVRQRGFDLAEKQIGSLIGLRELICFLLTLWRITMEMRFELVGMRFRGALAVEAVNDLKIGDTVQLQREPDNKFDPNAIKVLMRGVFVAYVAKDAAGQIATHMDQQVDARNAHEAEMESAVVETYQELVHNAIITDVYTFPKGNIVFAAYAFE